MKMRAVVYNRKLGKLEYKDKEKPVCGESDVIIKVEAVAICGGDLHFYTGGFVSPSDNDEFIPGHEFAGTIAEVGSRTPRGWKVGDRVVTDNTGGACGVCPSCAKGHFVNCEKREVLGLTMDGGFTQYVRVPGSIIALHPNCMFRIPEGVSFSEATILEPAANAYRCVFQEAQVKAGENVLVYGPGPIGLLAVQMAKLAGASNIILVGQSISRDVRAKVGLKYGATHWLENDNGQDIEAEVKKILGDDRIDAVIDAVGHPAILEEAMRIVRAEGIIVRAGMSEKEMMMSVNLLTIKAIKLFGHMGYDTECWNNCIRLLRLGQLDLKTIISHELPLDQWEEGIKMSIDNTAAKVVLIP